MEGLELPETPANLIAYNKVELDHFSPVRVLLAHSLAERVRFARQARDDGRVHRNVLCGCRDRMIIG